MSSINIFGVVMVFLFVTNYRDLREPLATLVRPESLDLLWVFRTGKQMHVALCCDVNTLTLFLIFASGSHGSPWSCRPPWKERRGCKCTGLISYQFIYLYISYIHIHIYQFRLRNVLSHHFIQISPTLFLSGWVWQTRSPRWARTFWPSGKLLILTTDM